MTGKLPSPISLSRWKGSQRRIGITGGIASGKSSVAHYLNLIKNLPILDVDIYAHEALTPGQASTVAVLNRYGKRVANKGPNNQDSINRSALGEIIFSNSNERIWLEHLLHPIIVKRLQAEIQQEKNSPTIALIIPLLFESKLNELCSEVWVVNCTAEQQFKRLITRDALTAEEAQLRINAQWPLKNKVSCADVVIDNSGQYESWVDQVNNLL